MNNSVIWFPELIEKYFHSLLSQKSDVIAASISNQYRSHIQTFLFGSLTKKGNLEILKWLKTIKNWRMKRSIVRLGEIGTQKILNSNVKTLSYPSLSALQQFGLEKIHNFFQKGFKEGESFTNARLQRNRSFAMAGIPINPSHDYWLEMLELGFPGIKVDFIRSNPSRIYDYDAAVSELLDFGFDFGSQVELIHSNRSTSIIMKVRSFLNW
jgi:hypothetical protein